MKKVLFLLFVLVVTVSFVACGDVPPTECTVHLDDNSDGRCDICDAVVEPEDKPDEKPDASELVLIEDGKANFQIVTTADVSSSSTVKKAVDGLVKTLKELDVKVEQVAEEADNMKPCEVIVGVPATRGDAYGYDMHDLGNEGYLIKLIDGKILIVGGGDAGFVKAIEVFTEDFLGIDKKTKKLESVVIKSSQSVEEKQDDYRITSLKLDGEDMKGYTIAADLTDRNVKTVVELIRSSLYIKTGYWLEAVTPDKADKSIIIKVIPNTYEGDGFYVKVEDGCLVFETEFPNKLEKCVSDFLAANITVAQGEVNFTAKEHKDSINVREITYEEFGAVSNDGKDDFEAFKKTHEYANTWGHTVKAKSGGKYLFGKGSGKNSIIVKTDTDWNGSTLIFDDSDIVANRDPEFFTSIFKISPDADSYKVDVTNFAHVTKDNPWIDEGDNITTNIGWKPGEKVLLYITSDERKQYIRYGNNQNNGSNQQEVILVDAEGNIDPATPLQWTYTRITSARVYSANERQITVGNARIEQIMNRSPSLYHYAARNILINRSNTLFTDVNHQITDEVEGDSGSEPYTGFVVIENCDSTTVRNYTFKGPKSYYTENSNSGLRTVMGSYGTTAARCTNITWDHTVQTDYRLADGTIAKNGSHGSNYCKNLKLINNSALSLFDAHCGTYNCTVTDSEIVSLNLIGEGLLYMENVNLAIDGKSHYSIGLREDYGSTWKGEVIVKDCTVDGAVGMTDYSLFRVSSLALDHDFGYPCYFPIKITVEGLKYKNVLPGTRIHLAQWLETRKDDISVPEAEGGAGGINPYYGCEELYFIDCDMEGWVLPNTPQFKKMKVFIDGEEEAAWKTKYGSK